MPLTGLRVVDLSRMLAGPFCSMLLGDMGAELIKIETPGEGDPVRRQGVMRDGLSRYFAGFNRNKRSLTLNLRHEEGREIFGKLIANSGVLVENFRPGVRRRDRHFAIGGAEQARRSISACSTRLARPSCATTRISAATTTASETGAR